MSNSSRTGTESSKWTKGEALEILAECRMIRESCALLEAKAKKVLLEPETRVSLEVIHGGKADKETG